MKKLINIKAVSPYFTIQETVEESKAVKKLEKIREMFNYYHNPVLEKPKWWNHKIPTVRGRFYIPDAKLVVNTVVANPELF